MSTQEQKNRAGQKRVLVLGAGVAGLTAAHELVERGYEVVVIEQAMWPGGKAATQYPWKHFGHSGGPIQVPAEHGFRLFPSFYRHVIDSMQRIPFARPEVRRTPRVRLGVQEAQAHDDKAEGTRFAMGAPSHHTVADNLIATQHVAMARHGQPPYVFPRAYGSTPDGFLRLLRDAMSPNFSSRMEGNDVERFQLKTLQYLTSCQQRRDDVERPHCYGNMTWWQYLGADAFSEEVRNELDTFIRTMVAMEAGTGNARTIGNVGMQLALDWLTDGSRVDRVLNGPSSDHWLLPWEAYLRKCGVRFEYGVCVTQLTYDRSTQKIERVTLEGPGGKSKECARGRHFEYVVAALPADGMKRLLAQTSADDLCRDEPRLAWIRDLDLARYTAWMAGIQYYLVDRDVPIVPGHVYYPESSWKLSSVSQAQFWGSDFFNTYGRGQFRGILSVDICDWERREGQHTRDAYGRVARECASAQVVAEEIWEQLRHSLSNGDGSLLPEACPPFHLDDSIRFPHPEPRPEREPRSPRLGEASSGRRLAHTSSPYFIHPPGSHRERPPARLLIKNLVLAGDYVLTQTDLATMEGANEAARLAVNAILEMNQDDGQGCTLFSFSEPEQLSFFKKLDEDLYNRGEPHLYEVLDLFRHVEPGSSPAEAQSALQMALSAVQGSQFIAGGSVNSFTRRP